MNVEYSKDFEKSVKKLSGKMLDSIRRVIAEVKVSSFCCNYLKRLSNL